MRVFLLLWLYRGVVKTHNEKQGPVGSAATVPTEALRLTGYFLAVISIVPYKSSYPFPIDAAHLFALGHKQLTRIRW